MELTKLTAEITSIIGFLQLLHHQHSSRSSHVAQRFQQENYRIDSASFNAAARLIEIRSLRMKLCSLEILTRSIL